MRPVVAASLVTIIALMPVFLLGPVAVLVRHDLHFTDAQLGLGVSAYFAVSALSAVPNGRLAERLGDRRTLVLAATGSGVVLLGMTLAWSWTVIFVCLALGGITQTMSQLGANLRLAGSVPLSRQGFAFGIKQAGPPVITIAGGLAVPLVAINFGWRWVFAGATVVAFVTAALMLRRRRPDISTRTDGKVADFARAPLVALGAASGCATAATSATATFLVPYLVDTGLEPSAAGLVLAVSSIAATATRLFVGWQADRRVGGNLYVIAGMLTTGALAVALFPLASTLPTLGLLSLVAYAIGWGWPGLFQLTIVKGNPQAPAAAGGVTYIGISGGGVVGPLLFGLVVSTSGYTAAWLITACWMLFSAFFMLVGRRLARRAWMPAAPAIPA